MNIMSYSLSEDETYIRHKCITSTTFIEKGLKVEKQLLVKPFVDDS